MGRKQYEWFVKIFLKLLSLCRSHVLTLPEQSLHRVLLLLTNLTVIAIRSQ